MRLGLRNSLARVVACACVLLSSPARPGTDAMPSPLPSRPGPAGSTLQPASFASLDGWASDDHAAAFVVFLRTCRALTDAAKPLRPGLAPARDLQAVCRDALAMVTPNGARARAFFEKRFDAYRVSPPEGQGFLTGYYEPELEGSLAKTDDFPVSVLARPADLLSAPAGQISGLDPALVAARKVGDALEPYPDRAQIWQGALDGRGLELAFVRDEVELFMAQVQGSARIRLRDGSVRRLVYAGRNGWPYTSIGKVIVAEGHMRLDDMSLESLKAWLRANPADARRILRLNRSYIFFAWGHGMDPADGPIGAASVPLTPLRSIAVDRTLWSYGTPFWIDADLRSATGARFRRLTIAQDTGSAILGPARADIFFGSGSAAGTQAGLVRHPGQFVVLLPKAAP